MKLKSLKVLAVIGLVSLSVLLVSCGDNSCPDGMHSQKLQDGSSICVPDNN